jgi:hypothetical protein
MVAIGMDGGLRAMEGQMVFPPNIHEEAGSLYKTEDSLYISFKLRAEDIIPKQKTLFSSYLSYPQQLLLLRSVTLPFRVYPHSVSLLPAITYNYLGRHGVKRRKYRYCDTINTPFLLRSPNAARLVSPHLTRGAVVGIVVRIDDASVAD